MSDSNQRQHPRVTVNQEFDTIDDFVSEYVSDISEGGVFIRSKKPLPVGTEVNLQFSILTEDFEMIEGIGRVVRVDNRPGREGMGVTFEKLTDESKVLVESIIGLPARTTSNS
jgi:uncharacterized protein (TIGR02266 family)